MGKTIFAVSDIHGNYQALKKALDVAGFDEENPKHLLISLGDAFDRGSESLTVYKYLKRLSDNNKAIVLKGNHTDFFVDYLEGINLSPFNYLKNGTNETLADFLHQTAPFETWFLLKNIEAPTIGDFAGWLSEARREINEEYPELIEWLKQRPYYYETEKYIFTHGSIDVEANDWHNPQCERFRYTNWDALMWDDGSFFGKNILNTNKTVVIGHFATSRLREMYGISCKEEDMHSILIRDDGRVIAIDACTILTNKVNVLVIENEETINE